MLKTCTNYHEVTEGGTESPQLDSFTDVQWRRSPLFRQACQVRIGVSLQQKKPDDKPSTRTRKAFCTLDWMRGWQQHFPITGPALAMKGEKTLLWLHTLQASISRIGMLLKKTTLSYESLRPWPIFKLIEYAKNFQE